MLVQLIILFGEWGLLADGFDLNLQAPDRSNQVIRAVPLQELEQLLGGMLVQDLQKLLLVVYGTSTLQYHVQIFPRPQNHIRILVQEVCNLIRLDRILHFSVTHQLVLRRIHHFCSMRNFLRGSLITPPRIQSCSISMYGTVACSMR